MGEGEGRGSFVIRPTHKHMLPLKEVGVQLSARVCGAGSGLDGLEEWVEGQYHVQRGQG